MGARQNDEQLDGPGAKESERLEAALPESTHRMAPLGMALWLPSLPLKGLLMAAQVDATVAVTPQPQFVPEEQRAARGVAGVAPEVRAAMAVEVRMAFPLEACRPVALEADRAIWLILMDLRHRSLGPTRFDKWTALD